MTLKYDINKESTKDIYSRDRKEFYSALLEKVDSIKEIKIETRKGLVNLILKRQSQEITTEMKVEWTKKEQDDFIGKISKINELEQTDETAKKLEEIVETEITREEIESFLRGKTYRTEVKEIEENEITDQEKELSIVVYKSFTAKECIDRMKATGYNCVILVDSDKQYLGTYKRENLDKFDDNKKIGEIPESEKIIEFLQINANEQVDDKIAKEKMLRLGVNILPIIFDTGKFYGILSIKNLDKNNIEKECIFEQKRLNLDLLKERLNLNK